jgi:predicted CXXCH cytochrome family protein
MRKIIIIGFVAFLSLILAYGFAIAAGSCASCHTMHYSQNGARPVNAAAGGPFDMLLVANGCWGCHGQGTSDNILGTGDTLPQVWHSNATDLAGGNFAYVTGLKTRDATDAGATKDTVGHNVIDIGSTYLEDTIPNVAASFPPGDQHGNYTAGLIRSTFTCAGKFGCHGDRIVEGELNAMKGAHHVNDSILKFGAGFTLTNQGSTVGLSYRFLLGVKGAEDSKWQANATSSVHNEYFGATTQATSSATSPAGSTISGLCAECHGNFHGATETGSPQPWLRHPTDFQLPSATAKEYWNYNPDTHTYNLDAPLARPVGFFTNALASSSDTGVPNGVTTNAIVMCLSCHKAHASANADILRWNYEDIQVGTGGNVKCFICHTTKND